MLCLYFASPAAWAGDKGINSASQGQQQAAVATVTAYLTALTQGDSAAIEGLIGGRFLDERRALLNNPTYPAMLRKLYGQAKFSILGSARADANRVHVDARIVLNPDERIEKRFYLANDSSTGRYLIIDEDGIE